MHTSNSTLVKVEQCSHVTAARLLLSIVTLSHLGTMSVCLVCRLSVYLELSGWIYGQVYFELLDSVHAG